MPPSITLNYFFILALKRSEKAEKRWHIEPLLLRATYNCTI